MIKKINCTLDGYDWVMAGADAPVSRCQNQTKSYGLMKARNDYY